jgi:hypothetical protein
MAEYDVMTWLLLNSGPVVRYRAMTELSASKDIGEISRAIKDLFSSRIVSQWLPRLGSGSSFKEIHSSNSDSIENTLYKLGHLGLKAGLQPFDSHTLSHRVWLSDRISSQSISFHDEMMQVIIAASLASAGYGDITPVQKKLKSRVEIINRFVSSSDWKDIYADSSEYAIPKSRRKWKLIDPSIYSESPFPLPWIHDLAGLAQSQNLLNDSSMVRKINTICRAIMHDDYQELPAGYGLVRGNDSYYVSGWSVHLPYFEVFTDRRVSSNDVIDGARLLLWLELLSPLPVVSQSDWFQNAILFLEEYRTRYDTYVFPRNWLKEKRTGYWINGAYMAFQSERRNRKDIECESTFRMLKLKYQARTLGGLGVS